MTQTPPTGATQQTPGELSKANSTIMVVIGCKLPNGFLCELGKWGQEDYHTVRLNGANDARLIGGYGFTDVSKDFWDKWYAKNKHLSFVKKGFVFAHADLASAADHAKDGASVRTGFEAIDPMKGLGLKDAAGKPLIEVDLGHFQQGQRDVANFGGARR